MLMLRPQDDEREAPRCRVPMTDDASAGAAGGNEPVDGRQSGEPGLSGDSELGGRLLLGTAVNVVGGVAGQAMTLATMFVALARVGAEAYGILAFALGVTQLPLLLEKGMGVCVLNAMHTMPGSRRRTSRLAVALLAYVGLGVATMVAGLIVSHLVLTRVIDVPSGLHGAAVRAFDVVTVAAGIRVVLTFTARSLAAESRLPTLRLIELTRDAGALVATLVLVDAGTGSLTWVAGALLIGDVAAGLVALFTARETWGEAMHLRAVDAAARRELVDTSKPYLAIAASGLMASRADPFIVGIVLGPSALAMHAVALRVLQMFSGAIDLLGLGVTSGTARLMAVGEPERIGGLYRKASGYAALVVWPCAVAVVGFAAHAAGALTDFDRGEMAWVLKAVMVLVVILVPVGQAWSVMYGSNQVRGLVRAQLVTTLVTLVLSLALVEPLGVTAVFVSSIVGACGAGLFLLPALERISGQPWDRLLSGLLRPGILAVGLLAVLLGVDRWAPGAVSKAGLGLVAFGVYGALGLWWVVPATDRKRLVDGLSRRAPSRGRSAR